MNKIEIILNNPSNQYLDVGDFDMSLNYSFNDIRDITKRNGSYSKTLIIPSTKNNNYVLGGLFDINSDFTLFNPSKKTDAKILVNSEIVMDGFIQLKKIKRISNVDVQGNQFFYEMVMFSNTINLYSDVDGKYISDLISLDKYNHIYNASNIISSWSRTDGYVYPLIGSLTSDNAYTANHFYPTVFYKDVFDALITEAGYGWKGSLKSNTQFNKEVIPFTGSTLPPISDAARLLKTFEVEIVEDTTEDFNNINIPSSQGFSGYWSQKITLPYTIKKYDYSNQFNTISHWWNVSTQGDYTLTFNLDYDVEFFHSYSNIVGNIGNYKYRINHRIQRQLSNTVWVDIDSVIVDDISAPASIPVGTATQTPISFSHTTPIVTLSADTNIRIYVEVYKISGDPYTEQGSFTNAIVNARFVFGDDNYMFNNSLTDTTGVGDEVVLKDFLPKLKQTDIISDLIKRYNLIVYQDADNENILVFDSYDDYYENESEILDWSDKKDYSKEDDITLLSELQYKTSKFSYTAEKLSDSLNELYTNITDEVYGEFEYEFDNDFVKGDNKITSPFSPTPLIKTQFGAYISDIDRDEPKGNPKVLMYNGLKPLDGTNVFSFNGTNYSSYPQMIHMDDAINPTIDMNFDRCRRYFYNDYNRITLNNQFNTYWSSYIKQIENGKMLTAYFNLNESDIYKVKNNFAFKVFVKDAYYYINNIIDYNPLNKQTTKVELLKVEDLKRYVDTNIADTITGNETCPTDLYIKNYGSTSYYRSVSNQTITESCCNSLGGVYNAANNSCEYVSDIPLTPPIGVRLVGGDDVLTGSGVVVGSNNTTGGVTNEAVRDEFGLDAVSTSVNKQIVLGIDNISLHDKTLILGDSNEVSNSSVVVLNGSNNAVKSTNTTLIGTSKQIIDDADKVYLGNKLNVDVETGDMYVDGTKIDRVYTATVRVTSAEILELVGEPKLLIPAVDINQYIMMSAATMYLDYNTTSYSGDNDLEIYVDTAEEMYFIGERFLHASVSGVYDFTKFVPFPPKTQSKLGKSVYLTAKNVPTDGDSDIIITIEYRIISIDS